MSITRIFSLLPLVVLFFAMTPCSAAEDSSFNLVEVTSGDTLFGIVRLHYPGSPSRWSLIENEVYKLNPQAFMNGDKGRLRLGAMLKLPVYAVAVEESPPEPAPPPPPRHSLATVGTVIEISGTSRAVDINKEQRPLSLGSDIFNGDAIRTEGDGAVHLQMNDGARLYVRSN
ncbi:MAG: hypothetical protein KJO35_04945, partial [Gammaproteobacteria bacterium]|nr:hypothetical protein [Gammaproteobacteria bacterium]